MVYNSEEVQRAWLLVVLSKDFLVKGTAPAKKNITWPTSVSIHDKILIGGKIHRYNDMRDIDKTPISPSSSCYYCCHPLCSCIYTALVSLIFGTVIPTSFNILMEMFLCALSVRMCQNAVNVCSQFSRGKFFLIHWTILQSSLALWNCRFSSTLKQVKPQ